MRTAITVGCLVGLYLCYGWHMRQKCWDLVEADDTVTKAQKVRLTLAIVFGWLPIATYEMVRGEREED